MESYPVKFKTEPNPQHRGGFILRYIRVAAIISNESPLRVVFDDQTKLHGAFLKAGLYVHSYGKEDSQYDVMPDPEQNYEVTDEMLKDIGFKFPD